MKNKEIKQFNVERLKKYIQQIKYDNSLQYAQNKNFNGIDQLQQILIGKMAMISEIDRIINFIEGDK